MFYKLKEDLICLKCPFKVNQIKYKRYKKSFKIFKKKKKISLVINFIEADFDNNFNQ